MRVGSRDDHFDFPEPGVEGALRAARIGYQRGVAHVRLLRRRGPYLIRVGHLRYRAGVHKTDRLDAPHTCARQRVEQPHLRLGGHRILVMQTVAWADLPQRDARWPGSHQPPTPYRMRDTIAVSYWPETNSALSSSSAKNGRLFLGPAIAKPARAARARSIASARSAPCTMSLAINES